MLFKLTHPRQDYTLVVQAFDRDFFKPNEIIGSYNIDLKQAILDCSLTKRMLPIKKEYFEKHMKDTATTGDAEDGAKSEIKWAEKNDQ